MKTIHFAIIIILSATVLVTIFDGTNISYGEAQFTIPRSSHDAPVMIRQVELYGPTITRNISACGSSETGPSRQWFTLHNPSDKTIQIQLNSMNVTNNSPDGGSMMMADKINLGPHKDCIFILMEIHQAFISDPRNTVISIGYDYSGTKYSLSTPPLTDTYNDTKIWKHERNDWKFFAPSPLEQTRSGVSSESVICNNDFRLVTNEYSHKPICVRPSSKLRMESIGWHEVKKPEYLPVLDRPYSSGPGFGCPFIFPSAAISSSSGFKIYNGSELTHYLLKPGQQGTITYNIYGSSYHLDPPIFSPERWKITNGVDISYQPTIYDIVTGKEKSLQISVLFDPESEILERNGNVTVVAKISADLDAQRGTYWFHFVPGGCSGLTAIPVVIGEQKDATDTS